ncbi:hypothetical protein [Arenibaculum sp.]|jgi:hypothetical protein|uniref:hypothetical protein n=1 Tax=Arenibaculum sp. TaxID=2865862 RepID=UPI002E0E2A41|nr:hypothetical protein [Arenibaculum sp.]
MAQRRDTRKGHPQPPATPVDMETGRVRSEIDQGRFRDKIPAEDPATVPLGTDAEAGGARMSATAAGRPGRAEPGHAPTGHPAGSVPTRRKGMMTLVSAAVGIVLLGILVLLLIGLV